MLKKGKQHGEDTEHVVYGEEYFIIMKIWHLSTAVMLSGQLTCGKFSFALSSQQENVNLFVLEGVGHCPHDDGLELVNSTLFPFPFQFPFHRFLTYVLF
ncbi:hypothetical protein RIF29_23545 [Crotalaria pallida]|uniref:Uncharacterized protein n=1 Tax=Crotalaria pallida TaxID=3830 RepID=A0AAN9FEM6_CROPI